MNLLPTLLLLAACHGKIADSLPAETAQPVDLDLDGSDTNEDCDDAVDAQTRYTDADGDGFGDDTTATQTCGDEGVAIGGDCDDSRVEAAPDQPELCETGADEDCDGLVDEDTWWYPDEDGDGYGVAEGASCSAEEPVGTSATEGDCDDSDPDIHPGVPEDCDDGVDQNCDGCTADCPASLPDHDWTSASAALIGESNNSGIYLKNAGDLSGDGVEDVCVGATRDSDGGADAGKVYLVTGSLASSRLLVDSDTIIVGDTNSSLGSCTGIADADGDGSAEFVVGASYDRLRGAAYVFLSPIPAGTLSTDEADGKIETANLNELLGLRLDSSSNLMSAATSPVVLGAPGGSTGGLVYLFQGPPSGVVSVTSADVVLSGPDNAMVGVGLQTGDDVNGDGTDDLLVGGSAREAALDPGSAFVVYGPVDTSMDLSDADVIATGGAHGDRFGAAVSLLDDLTGDGLPDLAVTAMMDTFGTSDSGAVYMFAGGGPSTLSTADATATFLGTASIPFSATSASVDLDGDSSSEFVIGAVHADPSGLTDAGQILIYAGQLEGTFGPDCASTRLDGTVSGEQAGQVANLGDLTGDGLDDLGIGVPGAHLTDDTTGGVYLFAGGSW